MMRLTLLLSAAITVLVSCSKQKELSINWENNKAVSVTIPVSDSVFVYVEDSDFDILGTQDIGSDVTTFFPVVPFERGQAYRVISDDEQFVFMVPRDTTAVAPRVLTSYPSCDTVPENLLKIYLQFDQPMMEGRSASYVALVDATTNDTVKGAFLDLQPELWNEDQTVLTLWLDPGRIKQDLIPNKTLGTVLNQNRTYALRVAAGWRSKSGLKTEEYVRHFLTKERDVQKPDVTTWDVNASSLDVVIGFKETLDWSLLNSTVSIIKGNEKIAFKSSTNECEQELHLTPVEPLAPGEYTIKVESRLEDLAGNNLDRLFETVVTEGAQPSNEKLFHTLTFIVR
ncbi:MAG TPA: Ig-like domain-containing protein [Cyclobacteriaceae bacterium]|nr:Ig-like domain-containing protein [Cyclobacteriaceae bacterium]